MYRRYRYSQRVGDADHNCLRLDISNRKIGGVCAGLARYWGAQTVFVRLAAVIVLLMAPHIALIGYGLTYLILD